jgi:hypothetical protein
VKLASTAMLCRNLRELRELICLSRLDYNQDDDCSGTSDSDEMWPISPRFQADHGSGRRSRSEYCVNDHSTSVGSSFSELDESVGTNGISVCQRYLSTGHSTQSSSSSYRSCNVLPSLQPLTPISANVQQLGVKIAASPLPAVSTGCSPHDFEVMLNNIDTGVVSDWLQEANDGVAKLSDWNKISENFVSFAHFWLSKISGSDRLALIRLEYGILIERLTAAFRADFPVKSHQIRALVEAVFHEFPRRILSTGGVHLVLRHLDILTLSHRDSEFCKLLSDIHCSTSCRQHTEIVLAMRAFAISSMLSAFVNFYCKLHDSSEVSHTTDMFDDNNDSSVNVDERKVLDQQRIVLAIRLCNVFVAGHCMLHMFFFYSTSI